MQPHVINILCLLFSFISGTHSSIIWPDCSTYKVNQNVSMWSATFFPISESNDTNADDCEDLCTVDEACGSYLVAEPAECKLYNINDDVIRDFFTSVAIPDNTGDGSMFWRSKACEYSVVSTRVDCSDYSNRHNNRHITARQPLSIAHNLPLSECQQLCVLHSKCVSIAMFESTSPAETICSLFDVTILQVLETGHGEVLGNTAESGFVVTSYDRYCDANSPYHPPGNSSTTESLSGTEDEEGTSEATNSVECNSQEALVTATIPLEMRDFPIVLYVGGHHHEERCAIRYSAEEVKRRDGVVTITVRYAECGAVIVDKHVALNSTVVAAIQPGQPIQMFSMYHIACDVMMVNDFVSTMIFNLSAPNEQPEDIVGNVVVEDVRDNSLVSCDLSLDNVEQDRIPANAQLSLRVSCAENHQGQTVESVACEEGTTTLGCDTDEWISVQSANYGRTVPGSEQCHHSQIRTTNCINDVTTQISDHCDDENECEVEALNSLYGDNCEGTYKYMNVTYQCVRAMPMPVIPFIPRDCYMTASDSFLLSVTLIDSNGCPQNNATIAVDDMGNKFINFDLIHIPFVSQVEFHCAANTCVGVCEQIDCSTEVDFMRKKRHISSRSINFNTKSYSIESTLLPGE